MTNDKNLYLHVHSIYGYQTWAICKSRNEELGNEMRGMMEMRGIRVEMWGIWVRMIGMAGNQGGNDGNDGNQDGNAGNQGGTAGNQGGNAGNRGENENQLKKLII